MAKKFESRFLKKEKIAKDTFSFYFEKKDLEFTPGDYLRLTLPIKNPDDRGSSRYFTIAASPLDRSIIITTRVVKTSFKRELAALKEGSVVNFFGPLANFDFEKLKEKDSVFLAGGIGITSFYSILKYFNQTNFKDKTYTLLVSFSTQADLIYFDELTNISKESGNIKVVYTLSSDSWDGEVGTIDESLIKRYVPDFIEKNFYIVGPPGMVEDLSEMVLTIGVPSENIVKEDFTGY